MDIQYGLAFLNQAMIAFIELIIGFILGAIARRITLKMMQELEISYLFGKATKLKVSFDNFVSTAVAYVIYIASIFFALTTLGVLKWVLAILATVLILIMLIGLYWFSISLLHNLWARFMLRKTNFSIGRHLLVKNREGKIVDISMQYIKLESGVHIPYYFLLKNKFRLN